MAFRSGSNLLLKMFQKLLGPMAAASSVVPLGLLDAATTTLVEGPILSVARGPYLYLVPWKLSGTGLGFQKEGSRDRRLQDSFGLTVQRQAGLWLLDGANVELAHQLPGNDGSAPTLKKIIH